MAKKTKQVATTINGREDLEQVLGEYAAAVIENKRRVLEMEAEINDVRQRYAEAVASDEETMQGLFEDIQAWAVLHPEEFKGAKSIDLLHAVVGFRTSPPAVKQVAGVKVDHTIARLRECGCVCYLREKTELDKDTLLAAFAAAKESAVTLAAYGLQVERKENFYVEVKHEQKGGE